MSHIGGLRWVVVLFVVAANASASQPPAPPDAERSAARSGLLQLTFAEPSPRRLENDRELQAQTQSSRRAAPYDLAQEPFRAFVPPSYPRDKRSYGLFVWISAGDA